MGGSKTTSKTQQQQTATTQLPAWMTSAGQNLFNDASATAKANPITAYTGQMTAGLTPNQQQAASTAASSAGAWQPAMAQGQAMTQQAGTAPMLSVAADNPRAVMQTCAPTVKAGHVSTSVWDQAAADRYMNPYLKTVQGNTLDTMRTQDAADTADLNDQIQGANAFGGTRGALMQTEQQKNQAKARQDYVDSSTAAAYDNAQGMFTSDMGRQLAADQSNQSADLQAATSNATFLDNLLGRNQSATNTMANDNANRNLSASTSNATNWQSMLDRMLKAGGQLGDQAGQQGALATQDIANLSATGAAQQATDQAADDAKYREFLRMQDAPLDQYQTLMAILSGTPRDVTTNSTASGTTTQKSSTSMLNQLLGAAATGASIYSTVSDRRLKRDISRIDELPNGLGVYRYHYAWEADAEPHHIGVMADEVRDIMPDALGPMLPGGYMTVDYSKLMGAL